MRTRLLSVASAAALLLPITALVAGAPDAAARGASGQDKPGHYSFAVIGDVPYGDAEIAAFPGKVDRVNADRDVEFTVHVGDIKNGSSKCTDEYNAFIKTQFNRFREPLIYTPGDNEWTDCHRPAAGGYNPLERLATIRATFFAQPGKTLGAKPMKVNSQAALGIPENVSFRKHRISVAAIHVVGSNNDRAPWAGIGQTSANPEQLAEEQARMAASIAEVRATFATARQRHDRAVVIFQQADMFDPSYTPTTASTSAFNPLVQTLVDESKAFDGEVYLFDGDSHKYNVDQPLASGSKWLSYYGVSGSAERLTRVTVDGEALATNYLKVTITRPNAARVLTWERVPYAS